MRAFGSDLRRSIWAVCLSLILVAGATPASAKNQNRTLQDTGNDAGQGSRERAGTWELVSVASDGTKGNGDSGYSCANGAFDGATISDDERFVAFASIATNLDPRDVNGSIQSDVFVHDRRSGKTRLISLTSEGALPDIPDIGTCNGIDPNNLFGGGAHTPQISANGRFVAFADDRNLTDDDDDLFQQDVYLTDLRKGQVELISVDSTQESPGGHHPPDAVQKPSLGISGNGRYVVFLSRSYDLDRDVEVESGPLDDALDNPVLCVETAHRSCSVQVFVRDRKRQTTKMVSLSPTGVPADADTFRPSVSDDGRYVVFESFATNLSPEDPAPQACTDITGQGRCGDVFIHDMKTGETELVSVDSSEQRGQSAKDLLYTSGSVVTPNGRYVAFGGAGELVPGGGGLLSSATYVRDRKTGRTENVAVTSAGELLETTGDPSISDDGRYVYFVGRLSAGSAGCPGAEACSGRLRYDRLTGQTDWIWIYDVRGSHGTSIGGSGQVFLENTDGRFHDPLVDDDDGPGETHDLFLRDLGIEGLGAAGLGAQSSSSGVTAPGDAFADSGIVWLPDRGDDVLSGLEAAEIVDGRLAYRPALQDLYVRIDVEKLARPFDVSGSSNILGAPLLYWVEIVAGGERYQLRMSDHPRPLFGLFRCLASGCSEIAQLRGGFGTTGEAVVAAIPLSYLGLQSGGEIAEIRAFAGLGTYATGPIHLLDESALRR